MSEGNAGTSQIAEYVERRPGQGASKATIHREPTEAAGAEGSSNVREVKWRSFVRHKCVFKLATFRSLPD